MKIEETDPTTDEDRLSFPASKMTRRRALSFLAGSVLGAVVMFYFGFPSSSRVSADSSGDNSTSTSEPSTTTTAKGGGGW